MSKKNIFVFIVLVIISLIGIYSVRAGTLEFDGVPVDITTSANEDLIIVPGTGGNTQIGDASGTNSNATSNDDLHVTGSVESDGAIYADSGITVGSNIISDTDSADSLGSSTKAWLSLYTDTISTTTSTDLGLSPASGSGVDYTITRSAATGNEAAVDIAATINKATSGNYTGIKLNVTETSAPGASDKLLDLQVGTVPYFQIFNSAASANYGLLSVGSDDWDGSTDGYFDGNANGTLIAGNAASGYEGNLMDLQIGGTSMFNVDADGNVTAAGTLAGSGLLGGSGTAGYLSKWSAATTLDDSVIYDDGTNVGIGTTAPGAILTIEGGTGGEKIRFTRDDRETWSIYQTSIGSDGLSFYNVDDTAHRLFLAEDGNIGIGISNPSVKLDIGGVDNDRLQVSDATGTRVVLGTSGANGGFLNLIAPGGATSALIRSYASSGVQGYFIGGNIGIGTTAPSAVLDISGTTAAQLLRVTNTTASGSGEGAGIITYSNDGAALASGDRLGFQLFGGSTTAGSVAHGGGIVAYADAAWGSSDAPTRLEFEVAPDGSATRATAMTVKSGGKVGIGTTNPSTKLEVSGTVTATALDAATLDLNSSASLSGATSGVVLVDATYGLSLGSASTTAALSLLSTNGDLRGLEIIGPLEQLQPLIYVSQSGFASNDVMAVDGDGDGSGDLFVIDSGGNVGIGAAIPSSKLEVNGTVTATAFSTATNTIDGYSLDADDGSPEDVVYVDADGKVGIGRTNPSQKLDVNGTLNVGTGTNTGIIQMGNSEVFEVSNSPSLLEINDAGFTSVSFEGNVGIGTSAPDFELDIYDGTNQNAYLQIGQVNTGTGIGDGLLIGYGSANDAQMLNKENTAMRFYTNNTEYLTILAAGNVGIGTTNPSGLLHVSGTPGTSTSVTAKIGGFDEAVGNYAGLLLGGASSSANVRYKGGVFFEPTAVGWGVGKLHFVTDNTGDNSDANLADARMTIDNTGNVGIGTTDPGYTLEVNGNAHITGEITAGTKTFLIDHPLDSENMFLQHGCLEGPEYGVYYRGQARLAAGTAVVELPSYFEALTAAEGRTVLLTAKGDEPFILSASEVVNGRFTAYGTKADGRFCWEVRAERKDIEPLVTEFNK